MNVQDIDNLIHTSQVMLGRTIGLNYRWQLPSMSPMDYLHSRLDLSTLLSTDPHWIRRYNRIADEFSATIDRCANIVD